MCQFSLKSAYCYVRTTKSWNSMYISIYVHYISKYHNAMRLKTANRFKHFLCQLFIFLKEQVLRGARCGQQAACHIWHTDIRSKRTVDVASRLEIFRIGQKKKRRKVGIVVVCDCIERLLMKLGAAAINPNQRPLLRILKPFLTKTLQLLQIGVEGHVSILGVERPL